MTVVVDREVVYRDHVIHVRGDGTVAIFLPDGSFLLAGKIELDTARDVVDSISEAAA